MIFFSLNGKCGNYIDWLSNNEQSLHSLYKPHLGMVIIPFLLYCWIWFSKNLLRIYTYVHENYLFLIFFFCDVFFWFGCNAILLTDPSFMLKRIETRKWQGFCKHPTEHNFWIQNQCHLLCCELDIISCMFCSWIQNTDGSHVGYSDNWLL